VREVKLSFKSTDPRISQAFSWTIRATRDSPTLDLLGVASDSGPAASVTNGHAVRWAAPEVLGTERPVSRESDVYSFAMVVIEVQVLPGFASAYSYTTDRGGYP